METLWREWAREWEYVGAENTGDDVESDAEWFQEVLSMVLDTTAKKTRIWARSKRWWNRKIDQRRGQLG